MSLLAAFLIGAAFGSSERLWRLARKVVDERKAQRTRRKRIIVNPVDLRRVPRAFLTVSHG